MWWTLGVVCIALLIGGIAFVIYASVSASRARHYTMTHGVPTIGWIVQANEGLFKKGWMDLPAQVLISPDEHTARDGEFMSDLALRIAELKGQDCDDEDDAFVSGLVTDERYREGRRDALPESFADGREVYLAHVYVYRDDLPQRRLTRPYIHCQVVWDEPGTLICSRPKKPRSRG